MSCPRRAMDIRKRKLKTNTSADVLARKLTLDIRRSFPGIRRTHGSGLYISLNSSRPKSTLVTAAHHLLHSEIKS